MEKETVYYIGSLQWEWKEIFNQYYLETDVNKTKKKKSKAVNKCKFCNKRYSSKHNLKRHMKLHSGSKPFQCSYCKKSFAQKRTLTNHLGTRTGEKSYDIKVNKKKISSWKNFEKMLGKNSKFSKCSTKKITKKSDDFSLFLSSSSL